MSNTEVENKHDPRQHLHARSVDGNRISYVCGCVNEVHDSGALRCVSKCPDHARERLPVETLGRTYFEAIGVIVEGVPQCRHYLGELREALGNFPSGFDHELALEIGPGCSMYAPGILASEYRYEAVEPCPWAAAWTSSTFDARVYVQRFEEFEGRHGVYDLIIASHSLEHMDDAPGMIRKCASLLSRFGELWIVIPDDSDPLNPDHTWYFNEASLRRCLADAGLAVEGFAIRKYIEREQFIYVKAYKY